MVQSIVAREISPLDEGVVTIGTLNCGSSQNIIAETCTMEGTIRAFDESVYESLLEKIIKILNGLKVAYDITYKIDHMPLYPPVYNDPSLCNQITKILSHDVRINKPNVINKILFLSVFNLIGINLLLIEKINVVLF